MTVIKSECTHILFLGMQSIPHLGAQRSVSVARRYCTGFARGGTIRGSINLPAQTLYPMIPTIYSLLSQSPVKEGRGVRAASWFADYIELQGETRLRSLVLEGGIKGWATAGKEYTDLMDEYDASAWAE
ncbi:uncharacterized protein An05g01180 [Aspergillus niger]|uniref:Contig An05c0040, genomic contig n=2 Tax=Aspergillus niger TaxID=5061 RepID=A2QKS0_ASPNC|nr:uncharacterized protein An05g01180 [Aspergillus niger]CAK39153.1 unnamed protein product [Aspergillus niger]